MDSKVRTKYEEWQRAVRQHDQQLLQARRQNLTPLQIRATSKGTRLAVAMAFARYQEAKIKPERGAAELLDAALRALRKPFPDTGGWVH